MQVVIQVSSDNLPLNRSSGSRGSLVMASRASRATWVGQVGVWLWRRCSLLRRLSAGHTLEGRMAEPHAQGYL